MSEITETDAAAIQKATGGTADVLELERELQVRRRARDQQRARLLVLRAQALTEVRDQNELVAVENRAAAIENRSAIVGPNHDAARDAQTRADDYAPQIRAVDSVLAGLDAEHAALYAERRGELVALAVAESSRAAEAARDAAKAMRHAVSASNLADEKWAKAWRGSGAPPEHYRERVANVHGDVRMPRQCVPALARLHTEAVHIGVADERWPIVELCAELVGRLEHLDTLPPGLLAGTELQLRAGVHVDVLSGRQVFVTRTDLSGNHLGWLPDEDVIAKVTPDEFAIVRWRWVAELPADHYDARDHAAPGSHSTTVESWTPESE